MENIPCKIRNLKRFNCFDLNYVFGKLLFLFFIFSFSFSFYSQSSVIKTVVIDAGHGGKDPGCSGSFSNEKHVCLSMALKLGAKIKENYEAIKQTILKEKPNGVKGDFILSAFLTSTMGVSYKLKLKG